MDHLMGDMGKCDFHMLAFGNLLLILDMPSPIHHWLVAVTNAASNASRFSGESAQSMKANGLSS
jgi:hypothetical protein